MSQSFLFGAPPKPVLDRQHVEIVRAFCGRTQLRTMVQYATTGEEREFYIEKFKEYAERVQSMPKTYEQDGKGQEAIVHLHYFTGNCDWWVTERDMEAEQLQAFGLADLGQGFPELGYISIAEITKYGAELDLYWTPKPLKEVRKK